MGKPRKLSGRPRPLGKLPSSETHLRVIGGSLRGRQFVYHGDPTTRPMKQRVREAAFNLIGPRVRGTHALDLFAGTGALAWEALSRGAVTATLIERHFPTARQIHQNAVSLGVADRVELITGDTFIWAHNHANTIRERHASLPWLIFCSPPYELFVSRPDAMLELIETLVGLAPVNSIIVVESDERFDTDRLSARVPWDVRCYPPAILAIGEHHQPTDAVSTVPVDA